MAGTDTVQSLVEKFALRRRARTIEFDEGVHLALMSAVTPEHFSTEQVLAQVHDSGTCHVRVFVASGQLLGECSGCPADSSSPCRHQVAVAHELWLRNHPGARPRA